MAILRQWNRAGHTSLLVTYSQYAGLALREGIAVKQIPAPEAEPLRRIVRQYPPRLFAVDTFPRGIVGETADLIPTLGCPAVLIQRYLNPLYLRQFNVAAFVGQHYRFVLRLADALPPQTLSQRTIDVPPVTIRSQRELPRNVMRAGWLFLDWGEGTEPYLAVALDLARRRGKPIRVVRRGEVFPPIELMQQAEVMAAGGGYNIFHEAGLTQTPTIFIPGRRMYDDQFGRAVNAPNARTPESFRSLLEGPPPQPPPAHAGEGAAVVVGHLEKLLKRSAKPPRRARPSKRPPKRATKRPARPKAKAARKRPRRPAKARRRR